MKSKIIIKTGPFYLLGLIFVVLRLCGQIDWNWAVVTLPFWAPFGFIAGIYALYFVARVIIVPVILGVLWLVLKPIEWVQSKL